MVLLCFTVTVNPIYVFIQLLLCRKINTVNLREVVEWSLQSAEVEPERGVTCSGDPSLHIKLFD